MHPAMLNGDGGRTVTLSDRIVIVTRHHICDLCDRPILPGRRSRKLVVVHNATFLSLRFCALCIGERTPYD